MESKRVRKWFSHPVLSIVLWITWLLLNNTVSMGHIVLGGILAILIPWLTSSFWPKKIIIHNIGTLIRFNFVVFYDILIANIVVARQVLSPNSSLNPGFLEVPLDITHPLGVSMLASTITLTPGTVSADLSRDKKFLTVHALHIENPNEEISFIKSRYEVPLMEVFKQC